MGPGALPGVEDEMPAGRRPVTCRKALSQPSHTVSALPLPFTCLSLPPPHPSLPATPPPWPPATNLLHPQGINIVPTVTRIDPRSVLRRLEPVNEVEPDSTINVNGPTVGNGFTASVQGQGAGR